jgi:hypothetical protein
MPTSISTTAFILKGRIAATLVAAMIALTAFTAMAPGTASASAEADTPTAAASGQGACSTPWKAVHGFVYRDCVTWQSAGGGAWFHTGLQFRNATGAYREALIEQSTIINGRVVGTTRCYAILAPNVTTTCWEPSDGRSLRFLPFGSYAYGNGKIIDTTTGQIGGVASPVLNLK